MLKKPVAIILLLGAVVIAAFVGGFFATRVKVPDSFPQLEDQAGKSADTGGTVPGPRPSGNGGGGGVPGGGAVGGGGGAASRHRERLWVT